MTKETTPKEIEVELPPESSKGVCWHEMRRRYIFDFPFLEVSHFLRQELGNQIAYSGWVLKKTTGWRADKEAILEDVNMAADERIKKHTEDEMVRAKKLYIQEMKHRILLNPNRMNHKELASNLAAIKTELGEPSRITTQKVEDTSRTNIDEMHARIMKRYEKGENRNAAKATKRKSRKKAKRKPKADGEAVSK